MRCTISRVKTIKKKNVHHYKQYLGFVVEDFCRGPHNLDVILLAHHVETAAQWNSKCSEKAASTVGTNVRSSKPTTQISDSYRVIHLYHF